MIPANAMMREALDTLRARGLMPIVKQGGKHVKIKWRDRGRSYTLVVARSPSGNRAQQNSRATLRRLLNGTGSR